MDAQPLTSNSTRIRGARMHNLQGIDCEIPRGKITVITGVSGSGKSTLAFDVLYAEGQRRFVECLSAYARQFMERLERPDVDEIGRIQPPIALKQRVSIKNARSTVGSITELSDYLRLLFSHAGELHCLHCHGEVLRTGVEEGIEAIRRWPEGTRLALVAPLESAPDRAAIQRLRAQGYLRLLLDDQIVEIDDLLEGEEKPQRTRQKAGEKRRQGSAKQAGIVIDRIIVGKTRRGRMAEALESAWLHGSSLCWLHPLPDARQEPTTPTRSNGKRKKKVASASDPPRSLRGGLACTECGARAAEPRPALFSWNSPLGACQTCQGFGRITTVDRDKVVPDPRKNLRNHAVVPFSVPSARRWYLRLLKAAEAREIPTDMPFGKLKSEQQDWVFKGDKSFSGVEGFFKRRERKRYKMHVRIFIARFRGYDTCPTCQGTRLKPEALAATVDGKNIHQLHEMPIGELSRFLEELNLPRKTRAKVKSLLESTHLRIACLEDVGVGYLSLSRSGRSLSGGETQRIRIAAALGNSLTDTLFILDEPTVGLHATDTRRMLGVLKRMAETGNTVIVVEHDPGIIEAADHLIVLGPGGGRQGGQLVYEGPAAPFLQKHPGFFVASDTWARQADNNQPYQAARGRRGTRSGRKHTARANVRADSLASPWDAAAVNQWLYGRRQVAERAPRGPAIALEIRDAREHNLKIPKLLVPLSGLTVITGVSGSGKSTLLDEIIHRNWLRTHGRPVEAVGEVGQIDGLDKITDASLVGQDLPGRSSRSNPISFVKAYAEIRKLLAETLQARQRGLEPGAFSFNTPGGRCEPCRGMGTQTLEMYFLPDVEVPCEVCGGKRFRPEVLEVTWREKNVHDILDMTVDEATEFFAGQPRIIERLTPLREVGLGYIVLGQSTATLSGGEGQRLKIAAFLTNPSGDGRHLFLFDEPTTGLHARDIGRLLRALRSLIAVGHAVIAVEHHLDFIRSADWVIDLGPGPGDAGGRVVLSGPVPALLKHETSQTAQALRDHLRRVAAWRERSEPPAQPRGG